MSDDDDTAEKVEAGEITLADFDRALASLALEIVKSAKKLKGRNDLPIRLEAMKVATSYRGMMARSATGEPEDQLTELREFLGEDKPEEDPDPEPPGLGEPDEPEDEI